MIKRALTTLKSIFKVKKSSYLYKIRNFLLYPMWDITNTPPCRHNIPVVSHRITGPNRKTPFMRPNKPPHRSHGSTLISFVTTHTQPCRYCLLWVQRDQASFKAIRPQKADNIYTIGCGSLQMIFD